MTEPARALIRSLVQLRAEQRTGVLEVLADGVKTFVYVARGECVFAEDSTAGETLGRLLVRRKLLTEAQYLEVIERMTDALVVNEQLRFGEVCAELGFLTQDDVRRALTDQVRWKIIRIFQRDQPTWTFVESEARVADVPSFPMAVEALTLDAMRWLDDERKEALGLAASSALFLAANLDPAEIDRRFDLTKPEALFLREALKGDRNVAALLAETRTDEVDAHALLTALLLTGVVRTKERISEPRIPAPPSERKLPRLGPPPARAPNLDGAKVRGALARIKLAKIDPQKKDEELAQRTSNPHEARLLAEQAFQRGRGYVRSEQAPRGRAELERAAALQPDNLEYGLHARWVASGVDGTRTDVAERTELLRAARAAVVADPYFAFAHYVIGELAHLDGNDELAQKNLRRALRIDGELVEALRLTRLLTLRAERPKDERSPVAPQAVPATPEGRKGEDSSQRRVPPPLPPMDAAAAGEPAPAAAPVRESPRAAPAVAETPPRKSDPKIAAGAAKADAKAEKDKADAKAKAEKDKADAKAKAKGTAGGSPAATRRTVLLGILLGLVVGIGSMIALGLASSQPAPSVPPSLGTAPSPPTAPSAAPPPAPRPADAQAPADAAPHDAAPRDAAAVDAGATATAATAADAATEAPIGPKETRVTLPKGSVGRRVIVDGKNLGDATAVMRLPCGKHEVRIGSQGEPRTVDLPCGQPFTLP